MYQCKAGHLAIHKYLDKRKTEGKNPRMTYFFDIEKCKRCPKFHHYKNIESDSLEINRDSTKNITK